MDLEIAIQSEVSQKEKTKYGIETHICGIEKSGIDDFICKTERETWMQRTNIWIPRREGVGGMGRLGPKCVHY